MPSPPAASTASSASLQLLLAARGADHLGALAPEQLERGAADAAARPADHRDLAGDAAVAAVLTHLLSSVGDDAAIRYSPLGSARPRRLAAALS